MCKNQQINFLYTVPLSSNSSPESVVINDLFIRSSRGVSRCWEGAELLLTQLAAFTLVTDNLCRLPLCSSSRRQCHALYLETGLKSPLFCTQKFWVQKQREPLRLHGKISSRYVFGVYIYCPVLCGCSIIYNTKLCVHHTYIVYTTLAVNIPCVGQHGARLIELMRLFT
jgi:hypothetical protein